AAGRPSRCFVACRSHKNDQNLFGERTMLNLMRDKRSLMIGAALGALFVSQSAFAQDGATAAANDEEGLAEIVVTAERRPENQQDVPLSGAVLPAAQARD
ncbi:hypothetical protein, partial [Escherichia coli]|uniref:hypothetical protein n=1 Tax=Escherichia coli TaxID=562 RepID=UPI003CEAD851